MTDKEALNLAAPVQEPVGKYTGKTWYGLSIISLYDEIPVGTLLYATPPAAQRPRVRLSEEDIDEIFNNHPTYCLDHFVFAEDVISKYEEKNAAAQPAVPDAIGPNEDELPAYAAGWNDCRAEMLKAREA
jgi:hypothetical protein